MIKDKKILLIFFTLVVLTTVFFQAQNYLWRGHLEVDVYVFYKRVEFFLNNAGLSNLKGNEYLPGSLLFFFAPFLFNLFSLSQLDYSVYLTSFQLLILLFIIFHLRFYLQKRPYLNSFLFLMLVLGTGPILLFRFEMAVSILALLSILFFKKNKYYLSFLFLGLAVSLKVYPLIFLPYLLLLLLFKKRYKKAGLGFLVFLLGFLITVIPFYLFGGDYKQIKSSLQFHAEKPLSIESMYGSFLTFESLVKSGRPPHLIGGYGVWGIKNSLNDNIFLNWFWVLVLTCFYIFLYFKKFFHKKIKPGVFLLLSLLFLIFSKNLHPQYIFWFISFIPFLKYSKKHQFDYLVIFFIAFLIAFINQLVYPILYTQFLEQFYELGRNIEVFYLQFLRNISIIFLFVISLKYIVFKESIE
jgi:hypothetical protein